MDNHGTAIDETRLRCAGYVEAFASAEDKNEARHSRPPPLIQSFSRRMIASASVRTTVS